MIIKNLRPKPQLLSPSQAKMPRQSPNLRNTKASPKKPPDPTLDQTNEGTTRTNIMLGAAGKISSVNLVKVVPKRRALGG